jgi:cbb3-type cytochrome oxidase subunit 1
MVSNIGVMLFIAIIKSRYLLGLLIPKAKPVIGATLSLVIISPLIDFNGNPLMILLGSWRKATLKYSKTFFLSFWVLSHYRLSAKTCQ